MIFHVPDIVTLASWAGIAALMLMHIRFQSVGRVISKRWPLWPTVAGGFAVGYVFLVLLPKLAVFGDKIGLEFPNNPLIAPTLVYGCMLFGFIGYWLVDSHGSEASDNNSNWRRLQVASFFFYNLLMGELLVSEKANSVMLVLVAAVAIFFHLAGMNHLFHHWDKNYYKVRIRWLLALGILVGAISGSYEFISSRLLGLSVAFMGGAILINVMYYEMPKSGKYHTKPFLLGICIFIIFISLIRFMQ